MRVTRRVEDHIRTVLNNKVLTKYHKYEDVEKLIRIVDRDIDERVDTFRNKLWEEAEEKYPDLKLMPNSTGYRRKNPLTHPEVKAEDIVKRIAEEAVSKAVESVVVSLELGAPASQLETLIDEAYHGVLKYVEERTAKIVD
jgi:hypothetical protein